MFLISKIVPVSQESIGKLLWECLKVLQVHTVAGYGRSPVVQNKQVFVNFISVNIVKFASTDFKFEGKISQTNHLFEKKYTTLAMISQNYDRFTFTVGCW